MSLLRSLETRAETATTDDIFKSSQWGSDGEELTAPPAAPAPGGDVPAPAAIPGDGAPAPAAEGPPRVVSLGDERKGGGA